MTEQKQQLEQKLWDIANELRGKMGADEYPLARICNPCNQKTLLRHGLQIRDNWVNYKRGFIFFGSCDS